MDFGWALARMREGERVRRRDWKPGVYWELRGIAQSTLWSNGNENTEFSWSQVVQTDWELYRNRPAPLPSPQPGTLESVLPALKDGKRIKRKVSQTVMHISDRWAWTFDFADLMATDWEVVE